MPWTVYLKLLQRYGFHSSAAALVAHLIFFLSITVLVVVTVFLQVFLKALLFRHSIFLCLSMT
jgi:hypothetical protein